MYEVHSSLKIIFKRFYINYIHFVHEHRTKLDNLTILIEF